MPTFNPLIKSTVVETIKQTLREAEMSSFQLLRDSRQLCMDYYANEVLTENGGKDAYLRNHFRYWNGESGTWEGERAHPLYEHAPITEQLIDLKARNYIEQPKRKVNGKVADKYTGLLKASGFFPLSKRIEQQTQLLHDVAVGVFYNQEKKKLYFQIVRDYFPVFDEEDPLWIDPIAVIYPTTKRLNDGSVVYAYYDDEKFMEIDKFGRPQGEEMSNPIGVLPFFFVHRKHPIDSHFSQPREELVRANQAIDVAVTGLNHLMHDNGYKQFVIVGGSKQAAKLFVMGASRALHIETPEIPQAAGAVQPNAQVLDMQANFEQHLLVINSKMEFAANRMNLIVDWTFSGQSGSPLPGTVKLQNAKDTEDRQAQLEILEYFIEQPLYRIVSEISNTYGLGVEKGGILVDWAEPEVLTTPDQDMAREKHDLEIGKISVVDLLIQDNPELSREEAAEILVNNLKLNAYLTKPNPETDTILKILDGVDVDVEGITPEAPPKDAGQTGEGKEGSGNPLQRMAAQMGGA